MNKSKCDVCKGSGLLPVYIKSRLIDFKACESCADQWARYRESIKHQPGPNSIRQLERNPFYLMEQDYQDQWDDDISSGKIKMPNARI